MTKPHINSTKLISAHGGYRQLKSFQQAELVYDATVKFCDRFIDKRSRTHDQMVQRPVQKRKDDPRNHTNQHETRYHSNRLLSKASTVLLLNKTESEILHLLIC